METNGIDAANERSGNARTIAPLLDRLQRVRACSVQIAELFAPEDRLLQAMPEASPIKWHLAHTSWFFETFVLRQLSGYRSPDDRYEHLFNSYYNAVGPQANRAERGLWSRPSLDEVSQYRQWVDAELSHRFDGFDASTRERIELGLHHEQQHQELMLTDTLAALAKNPLQPAAVERRAPNRPMERSDSLSASLEPGSAAPLAYRAFPGGTYHLGHAGDDFCFDNETPRHAVLLADFHLASRPLTNGEVIEFIEAGGYRRPELWLSEGFDWVQRNAVQLPCYWSKGETNYRQYTLYGAVDVEPARTACHLSYFEADALARFFGARLPSEAEWEVAARAYQQERTAAVVEREQWFSPDQLLTEAADGFPLAQLFGTAWEWTSSPYVGYPGFRPAPGAIGEYNGKFMFGQMVLRGGSLATPVGHVRATYRNFFPATARWQFSGVRLARDAHD